MEGEKDKKRMGRDDGGGLTSQWMKAMFPGETSPVTTSTRLYRPTRTTRSKYVWLLFSESFPYATLDCQLEPASDNSTVVFKLPVLYWCNRLQVQEDTWMTVLPNEPTTQSHSI